MADPSAAAGAQGLIQARTQSTELEHLAVQANLQVALEVAFDRWGRRWLCMVVLLGFGMCGLLLWSQVVFEEHENDKCDEPLADMLRLLYITVAVRVFQQEIVSHCLCYNIARDGPIEPCRVSSFRRLSLAATLLWPCVAAMMLWESKECSPALKQVVGAITAYCAVGVLVVFVAPACCVSVVLCLIRRGIVIARSPNAAPPNLIHDLPDVPYDPAVFSGEPSPGCLPTQCSICLDSFDAQRPIKRTHCDPMPHAFHTDCLQGWLGYSTTCPLCRSDLQTGAATAAGEAPQSAGEP